MMDRFSLLLLDPGEIYFEDVACEMHVEASEQGQLGRLKICSKSLVFVPTDDLKEPLIKMPLINCNVIEEYRPRSVTRSLNLWPNALLVSNSNRALMLSRNVVAPFEFVARKTRFVFALKYAQIGDCVAQIAQLKRASTLKQSEQSAMIAAILFSRQSRSQFDAAHLDDINEQIILKGVANKVSPLVVNPGRLALTASTLYFQPFNNVEKTPVFKIQLNSIKRIFQRRYLLRPLGLEIEFERLDGRNEFIYLTFNEPEERHRLYHKIISQPSLSLEDNSEENMTLRWQNGLISNFEYLMHLNCVADRSFNDLTQYPVFPWVLSDYTSNSLDLSDPGIFRDLSKPMGALNEERLQSLLLRTADMDENRFLYGSHYSTPGFVLHFLMRTMPQCMLCLQNGRFDHPDRMFNSLSQTWTNVTTHPSDFKELVPQFYMPETKGDFLENRLNIDFGTRHNNEKVDDVQLPPWAQNSAEKFVNTMREALESDYVSRRLHNWIDLIFGYKQRGRQAEKAHNLFYHLCYEGSIDLDTLDSIEDRYALETQIGEFGQVPKQLFTSPHPQRLINNTNDDTNDNRRLSLGGCGLNNVIRRPFYKGDALFTRVCDYKLHSESISCVRFSPDKLWILSVSHDAMKMYSLSEMTHLRTIMLPDLMLSTCLPLPDNRTVLIASRKESICTYNIEFGTTSATVALHRDAISCMIWHRDLLCTGSWDGSVRLWHCNTLNSYKIDAQVDFIAHLDHSSHVTCLDICGFNSTLVSATREGCVYLWCLKSHKLIKMLPSHERQVKAVKLSHEGNRVVSCGSDFILRLVDVPSNTSLLEKNMGEELNCLAWDDVSVLVGGASGRVFLVDLRLGASVSCFGAHDDAVNDIDVIGNTVVTAGDDNRVVVFNIHSNK